MNEGFEEQENNSIKDEIIKLRKCLTDGISQLTFLKIKELRGRKLITREEQTTYLKERKKYLNNYFKDT